MHFETEFRYCIMKQIFTVCHQQTARKAYVLTYTLVPNFRGKSNNQIAIFEVKYLKFHLGAFYSTRPTTLH